MGERGNAPAPAAALRLIKLRGLCEDEPPVGGPLPHTSTLVALCLWALLPVTAVPALPAPEQLACQSAVAKQGRLLFKRQLKALASCEDRIAAGSLTTDTDCALEGRTSGRLESARRMLRGVIARGCRDGVVAGMEFGGQCAGVGTAAALASCLITTHEQGAAAVIALAYDPATPRTCSGGAKDGQRCARTADCVGGACVIGEEERECTSALAGSLGALADTRQGVLQRCKRQIALGALPPGTDCIASGQAVLDRSFGRARTALRAVCGAGVAERLAFGGACAHQSDPDALAACGNCAIGRQADAMVLAQYATAARGGAASARRVTDPADCIGGPLSRCRPDDYLLSNERIRIVVQDLQRNLFGIGQFGGQIIDADLVRSQGPDRDNFEEWSISLNIESTAHYTNLTIVNDGSDGGPAILRASGVDDLLDFINASSVVAAFNGALPASADDADIPVSITTDYVLEPGVNYVRAATTVRNLGPTALRIFFGEYINGSGQVELFQPGYGFGEALVASSCPTDKPNVCNFIAFSGENEGAGVSYGYVHELPGSSTFTRDGVVVPQLQVEILFALIGLAQPPFTLQPAGEPDDQLTLTRYFVVGDGTVSSITDARNDIQCLPTGRLEGTVTAGGAAAAGADVAVLGRPADGPGIAALTRNVVTHTRTDASGRFALTLPPGPYDLIANLDGSPYEANRDTPTVHPVSIAIGSTTALNLALPGTGSLRVTAADQNGAPLPAKVSVVGFDPSPDPLNSQSLFGIVNNRTAVFGERFQDGVPYGVSAAFFLGPDGTAEPRPLEPGTYEVYVSRGPEYSLASAPVVITAGETEQVDATVERVIDTSGFIAGDFHVHSIESPDSDVPRIARVLAMLGEGVEFFASTEHDNIVDFQADIEALGAVDLIGTTPGEEITTFDYGHFNAWPTSIDPTQVNGGAVDHGGAAAPGHDYPSAGAYSETPAEIIALARAAAPGAGNTVQINHIHSHFGLDGGSGLAIDTGLTPPASRVPAAARRLNPAMTNLFSGDFDALEVWIGDDRSQMLTNFLGQNAGDWFNLLNQGFVRSGLADSDTHNRFINAAGFPRTMVAMPTDEPGMLSGLADTVSANVNAGRAIGTNGPMLRVAIRAASTGQTASLELGDPTAIRTTDGAVEITVQIESPAWAEFDRVEYYVNSPTKRTARTNVQTGAGAVTVNRYAIMPDFVQNKGTDFEVEAVSVPGTTSSRLQATTTLDLVNLTRDIWLVVMVKGTDGISRPLYPVLPNGLRTASNRTLADLLDGNLGEDGVTALAFTNPLFVDVDGGGWTPPGVRIAP